MDNFFTLMLDNLVYGGILYLGYLVVKYFIVHLYNLWLKYRKGKILFYKIKSKLESDLLHSTFSNDWVKRQEVNAHILWLQTIKEIEQGNSDPGKNINNSKNLDEIDEINLLENLSIRQLAFPTTWRLNDRNHHQFFLNITISFSDLLAESNSNLYRPEHILPYPKDLTIKAFIYIINSFNISNPPNERLFEKLSTSKDAIKQNYERVKCGLETYFVNTEGRELPTDSLENFQVGNELASKQQKYDESFTVDWLDLSSYPTDKAY